MLKGIGLARQGLPFGDWLRRTLAGFNMKVRPAQVPDDRPTERKSATVRLSDKTSRALAFLLGKPVTEARKPVGVIVYAKRTDVNYGLITHVGNALGSWREKSSQPKKEAKEAAEHMLADKCPNTQALSLS